MENKVRDIQEYLEKRGINASETSIINAAIDIAERLGAGKYTFACEFELDQKRRAR